MNAVERNREEHDLDEGSWIYLSLSEADDPDSRSLRQSLVEACHKSGWPAISWSMPTRPEHDLDRSRFFGGMSDAVAHADLVVTLVDDRSTLGDAELAFAYRHRRPVVGIRFTGAGPDPSEVRAMLTDYGRGRIVDCESVDDCAEALRTALTDREFATIIHEASMEQAGDA